MRHLLPAGLLVTALAVLAPQSTSQERGSGRAARAAAGAQEVDLAERAGGEADAQTEQEKEKPKEKPVRAREKKLFRTEGDLPLAWVEGMRWRSIGPANMGGRVTDIAVHPSDPSTYWIAMATGGLLKTTNNGVAYEHRFDREATVSIGALAVSPADPNVLWVGTGEANPRNSVSFGDGVYRSTDGGESFVHVGLEDSFQIGAIAVHPSDADVAYVAALGRLWGPNEERGLFKTTDGGTSWEKVLYVDADTGVIDVLVNQGDPSIVVAATYERRRDGFDTNDPDVKWGDGGGLWRSSDAGATWTRVEKGLPACQLGRIGLDAYAADRDVLYAVIETERITQLPEDSAYLGLEGRDGDEVGARVRKVDDDSPAKQAGVQEDDLVVTFDGRIVTSWREMVKWTRQHTMGETATLGILRGKESLTLELLCAQHPQEKEDEESEESVTRARTRGGPFSSGLGGQRENIQDEQGVEGAEFGGLFRSDDGGQSWERVNSVNPRPMYYSQVRIDPSDDSFVYVLGTSLYRSTDGGKSFSSDGAGRDVHVDHHALWIDPRDGRHMILGNDGGIYVTWDRMETWDHHNHVALGQFYAVTNDGQVDYKVYGGLQDNGSWGGPGRSAGGRGATNVDWFRVGGGDGFICRVDAEDPNLVYYESQNGRMARRHLETGQGGFMQPRGGRGIRFRFNWKTPFLLSNHNSRIFYAAGNYVVRSIDRGNELRRISPEIAFTERGAGTALAESPREQDFLYVGTDDGALWRTLDGSAAWEDLFALNAPEETPAEEMPAPELESIAGAIDGVGDGPRSASVDRPQAPAGEGAEWTAEDDPLSGTWRAETGAGEEPAVELELVLAENGDVSGSLSSVLGAGPLTEGRFDRSTGDLRLVGTPGGVRAIIEGRLQGARLQAHLRAGGGMVDLEFVAQRVRGPQGEEIAPEAPEAMAEPSVPAEEADAVAAAAPAPVPVEAPPQEGAEPTEEAQASESRGETRKKKAKKHIEDTIDQLLPGRFHVSSIAASHHDDDRVYVTFDGHRSDDDRPWVFRSDDNGSSWADLRGNLPDAAGPARVITEDTVNEDLLFLGTEFGAFVSVDRGESWTRFHSNLPTVPVHDFSINEPHAELIAGTHGRSLWVIDLAPLRAITPEVLGARANLFPVPDARLYGRSLEWGSPGTRSFAGESVPQGATLTYTLRKRARSIELFVETLDGSRLATLTSSEEPGLHRAQWNLRGEGGEGRRRGRLVESGSVRAVLLVDGERSESVFRVLEAGD